MGSDGLLIIDRHNMDAIAEKPVCQLYGVRLTALPVRGVRMHHAFLSANICDIAHV